MNAKEAGNIINAAQQCLSRGSSTLSSLPKLIIRIIDEELWREIYIPSTKETVQFDSFVEFVTTGLPDGLGTTVELLQDLCQSNNTARSFITQAVKGKQGARTDLLDNIKKVNPPAPTGTSRDAALRRLRKDRPDLHEQVLADEISAHAAMVAAGFRKKPDPVTVIKREWRKATEEQRHELMEWINGN